MNQTNVFQTLSIYPYLNPNKSLSTNFEMRKSNIHLSLLKGYSDLHKHFIVTIAFPEGGESLICILITPLSIVFSLCPASISSIPEFKDRENDEHVGIKSQYAGRSTGEISFLFLFVFSRCMTSVQVQVVVNLQRPLHFTPTCLLGLLAAFPFIYPQPTHDPSARLRQVLCLHPPLQHRARVPL